MTLSFEELKSALKVTIPLKGFITGVSTDTRTLKPGELFIALSGENFNGNDYVREALEKGAAAAVCMATDFNEEKVVVVKDTLDALLSIASLFRDKFDLKLLALTGSVGKTTTRGMVSEVISSKYKTLVTQNNLNNEIGVSKTLLGLDPTYEAAVIEMGMNHFGEIERISRCAKPTLGIITNVGVAHIENLGTREGVLRAKLEITAGMKKNSPLILNGDNDLLKDYKNDEFRIIKFGIENKNCDVLADEIKQVSEGSYFTAHYGGKSVKGFVPALGKHNVMNAICAVAAGLFAGVELENSVRAIEGFKVEGRRQKIVKKHGFIFLEDCYNANPDSVAAALGILGQVECNRRIAVLGDMLELGAHSDSAHRKSGELAAKSADILFTLGEKSKQTALEAKKMGCGKSESFTSKQELTKRLCQTLKEGDAVLFKASRSMKLEDVISSIYSALFDEKEGRDNI